jgi:hypothetical protein
MQRLMESPLVTEKVNCGALGFLTVAVAFSGNWSSTAVFGIILACNDEIIPLQERIETVGDDADLQEVYGGLCAPRLTARRNTRLQFRSGVTDALTPCRVQVLFGQSVNHGRLER